MMSVRPATKSPSKVLMSQPENGLAMTPTALRSDASPAACGQHLRWQAAYAISTGPATRTNPAGRPQAAPTTEGQLLSMQEKRSAIYSF